MKIICIGRNYRDHAHELNNPVPEKPVVFIKSRNALLQNNKPFLYPEFTNDLHYEAELVLKISKNGRYIAQRKALQFVGEVTLGIDFTARDLQNELKSKGLPWELAKSFDQSAVVGQFVAAERFQDLQNLTFELKKNGQTVQTGNTAQMIFPIEKIINFVSHYFTLNIGDLIFTGTPAGVGPVEVYDEFEGYLEGELLFKTSIQ